MRQARDGLRMNRSPGYSMIQGAQRRHELINGDVAVLVQVEDLARLGELGG